MAERFSHNANLKITKAVKQVLNGVDLGGSGSSAPKSGLQCITVKLLSKIGTDAKYTFEQARKTSTGWETVDDGITDMDETYPAYDLDESSTADLSGSHAVLLRTKIGTEDSAGSTVSGWVIISVALDVRLRISGGWLQLTMNGGATWVNQIQLLDCSDSGS